MKLYQESLLKIKDLIFFLFFLTNCFSQQFPSQHISIKDGLPDKSIYSIIKDSKGVLWLGTLNGLVSISGNDMKIFKTAEGLPHNSCWQLIEDNNKNIWIGTFGGGLACYNGKNFKIINIEKGLVNNLIRKLFVYKNNLYVGTQNGVSIVDLKTHKVTSLKSNREKLQIMDFFVNDNKIYFATFSNGTYELKNNKFINVNSDSNIILSVHKSNDSLYISRDALRFGNFSLQKVAIKDYVSNKNIKPIAFSNTDYWGYTYDNQNNLYASAYGVSNPTGGFFQIKNKSAEKLNYLYGVESNDIWSIYFDKTNNHMFLGTLDDGLYIIDLNKKITFFPISNAKDYQQNELFGTILLSKEGLSIKKEKIFKITSNEFNAFLKKNFSNSNNRWQNFNGRILPKAIDYTVFELQSFKVFNGHIWVNSNLGIFKIKKDNRKFKITNYYPFFISNFFFTNDNSFLFQFPYEDFYQIKNLEKNNLVTSLSKLNKDLKGIVEVITTNKRTYYVSQFSGLIYYEKNNFISLFDYKLFEGKELKTACKINDYEFVVSNLNGDVFLVNDAGKIKITKIIKNKELFGNSIYALHCYENNIVIVTEKGINIYNRTTKQLQFIDNEQGIDYNRFVKSSLYKDLLLLVTDKGLYNINLRVNINSTKPKLKITSFKANDENITINQDKVLLDYSQNKIDITYTFPYHIYPNKVFYRYKVIGLKNSQWSEWNQYTNLALQYIPSGIYTIQLECKDLSIGKTYSYKLVNFEIKTPFWLNYYFYSFSFLFTLLLFLFIYKYRIKTIQKREAEKSLTEKRIVETKLEALQSQMNPHFVFNSMNAIHHYIISNDVDSSLNYINDFTKLMRTTLNNSSQTLVTLKSELNFLKLYVKIQNTRFNNSVGFQIDIDPKIKTTERFVPPMLLQPILENCFEHAFNHKEKGNVIQLNITENNQFLNIEVLDNGKGFNISELKKESKGIYLVKERLQLLHPTNDLIIDSNPNIQTKIRLILNKLALKPNLK
jgi:sensor histidine kinase YesM